MTCNQSVQRIKTRLLTGFAITGVCTSFVALAATAEIQSTNQTRLVAQAAISTGTAEKSTQAIVPPIPAAESASAGAMFEGTARKNDVQTGATSSAPAAAATQSNQPLKDQATSPATGASAVQAQALAPTESAATNTSTIQQNSPQAQTSANQGNSNPTDTKASGEKATANESQSNLVPNGAALQSQLLPLGQADKTPWSTLAAGGLLILGIAALGILAVKLKQGKGAFSSRGEKQLQLVTAMALSPKRQIVLVRIRDKEVALASTEHGITMLTELAAPMRQASLLEDGGSEEPRRRKVQQRVGAEDSVRLVASSTEKEESTGQETAIARSEMLMGALKNLREKNLRNKSTTATDSAPSQAVASKDSFAEKKLLESIDNPKTKNESTMKQTRAAFPKYVANAFEQESKRVLQPGQAQSSGSQEEAGNVTNMIRERLKELRPLA
jgi:flagellar biogenesis protein FliO